MPDVVDKILVVEDEPSLVETLEYNLARQGYQVLTARDGITAVNIARSERPDAILLDIMLPGMDGFEVCRVLRRDMTVPILMLTARDDEIDKVVGLEVGADDYLTKPFSMRELMARVKALLRRARLIEEQRTANTPPGPPAERLVFGNLTLDLTRREMLIDGQAASANPKEFDLMVFLARNRGVALSRDQILEKVWGWDFGGGTRTVDVHMRWLRAKIEPDAATPTRIVTVRGVGYRFDG
jgi:DNA-binding response OmpR family regulator